MASLIFNCIVCGKESRWVGDTLNPRPVPANFDNVCDDDREAYDAAVAAAEAVLASEGYTVEAPATSEPDVASPAIAQPEEGQSPQAKPGHDFEAGVAG